MEEMRFSVKIKARKEKVWAVLWQDETLRDWAGVIDPGTYMVGEIKEGGVVQFNSSEGYGVASLVFRMIENEFILLRHMADTKNGGCENREKQWSGGRESYRLTEKNNMTTLEIVIDVPKELKKIMENRYPKALARIKELSEN